MVEVRRVRVKRARAPEVPFARFLIALFTLAVLGGIYYVVGGPIPYVVSWNGPVGAAFAGRYAVVSEVSDALPDESEGFRGTYPHTVTVWGSRRQGVVASAQNEGDANVLTTLTVRRAGVICTEVYRWGTATTAVCNTP